MNKVLFVCTGNTCRSPMAEALLRHKSDSKMEVKSAGIFAGHGQAASRGTKEVLDEQDIQINHQSQPVTPSLIKWADLVLTMTTQHKQTLLMQYPESQDKVYTLKEYVDEEQQRIWNDLSTAYAELEEKRTQLTSNEQLEEKEMEEKLKDDLNRINELESQLSTPDISDPFGGNVDIYRKTLKEVEKYIELLLKKLDNENI